MEENTKVCSKCGRELPLSNFHRQSDSKDGYRYICKECMAAYYKRHNKEKLEKIKQTTREELLQQLTPRDLVLELKRRGYKGQLTYTEIRNINIDIETIS